MDKGAQWPCVVDASSLRVLARYFLPLDEDETLRRFISACFDDGRLVLLKKIAWEVRKVPELCGEDGLLQGVVRKNSLVLDRIQERVKQEWAYPRRLRRLSPGKIDKQYQEFLLEGDYQLLAYCLDQRDKNPGKRLMIITEETPHANDFKLFKKIPVICRIEGISCCDLMTFLQKQGFKAKFQFA